MQAIAETIRVGMNNGVVRSATGSFAVKVAATGLGFLTTLILARLLGAQGYGAYAYALAWVNLLCIVAQSGFERLLTREVAMFRANHDWATLNGLLRATNLISLGVGVVVAAFTAAAVWLWRDRLDEPLVTPLMVALVLVPVLSLTALRRAAMAGLHRVVEGQVPEKLLRPLFLLGTLYVVHVALDRKLDATVAIVCNIGAAIAAFIIGVVILSRALPTEVKGSRPHYELRPWMRSAVPLALLGGLQVLNYRVDNLMIGAIQGAGPVGVYSVVYQIVSLIGFITLAADGVTAPRFATLVGQGNTGGLQHLFTMATRSVFGLTLLAVLATVAAGEGILRVFGHEFSAGYTALVILALGRLLPAAIGPVGVLLTMARLEHLAVRSVVCALLLKVALNAILIPRMGITGAALSAALVSAIWFAVNGLLVYRKLGVVPTAAAHVEPDKGGEKPGRPG